METILLILTFTSFIVLWVTTIIFYTPACFNLLAMIESVDADGELSRTKAPASWYFFNMHAVDSWIMEMPKSHKYLKYKRVAKMVERIKACRKIMAVTAPVMFVGGFFFLLTVE